jgi:hypothetical protein
MRLTIIAAVVLAGVAGFAAGALADQALIVQNSHGGYNVIQPTGRKDSLPLFGSHGYAAVVVQQSHQPLKFVLVPVVQDMGHGQKVTVYKRVYFPTAEDAEAAKVKLLQ